MRTSSLIIRYATFAVMAMAANLLVQRIVLNAAPVDHALLLAIFAGTVCGLLLKYGLDKNWIFNYRCSGRRDHVRTFGSYALIGVCTTAIFWGFEILFWVIWSTDLAREIGAVIGLTIGYVIKYQLDLRFVFQNRSAQYSTS